MSEIFYQITKNEKINRENKKFSIQLLILSIKIRWILIALSVNLGSKIFRTKNNRIIMQSKCNDCRNKKSIFMKEQEAEGFLSNLGIKTPFTKLPILGDILF